MSVQNQLVAWINDAGMAEGHKKAVILRKLIEILLHQGSQFIPTYIDNVLSYSNDKSTEVRKLIVMFLEELSKNHQQYLELVVQQLRVRLSDSVIAVQKRVIQAASIVYRNTLLWICQNTASASEMQAAWEQLGQLKLQVLNQIDNDNEGIRTHSIKFLEEVMLLQSETIENELDNLPQMPSLNRTILEAESEQIFTLLLKFHNSQHISSVNLMACMTTLCLIAKIKPKFLNKVLQALNDLHTKLPPTLSQSQASSVRKHLKSQLVNLVRNPGASEILPQLAQLLHDIGMTSQEIAKVIPKERRNKRVGELKQDGPSKRFRVDSPQNSQGSDSSSSRQDFGFDDSNEGKIVSTEDALFEGLNNVENVVSLVMSTLLSKLPNEMPQLFTTIYKPIPNAGSQLQKRILAKMLVTMIKGESITQTQPLISNTTKIPLLKDSEEKITLKNAVAKLQMTNKADKQMEGALSRLMEETRQESLKEKDKPVAPPTPSIPRLKQRVRLLKLQEITRPIPKEIKEKLMIQAVDRILKAEKESAIGGAAQIRAKLITCFASSYTPELRELVLSYILEDPASRIDLALSWLYEEYAFMQSFNRHPVTLLPKIQDNPDINYNNLLCTLLTQICERGDPVMENSKEVMLRKIYLEAPLITEEAVDYLKHLVTEEKFSYLALEILEEICVMRRPRAHKYVSALLAHTINENPEIREVALKSCLKIYNKGSDSVKKVVEKYAKLYLGFIALNKPPIDLSSDRRIPYEVWTDDLYKLCLNLVMALFIENEDIIIEVARVYGQASADAKRCVLRAIEAPVRQVSAKGSEPRPSFLRLLEECPRGAETLLTRLVHILTEKAPPTQDLVDRVRELYATRVSDVRFLIPVLNGLTKREVLAALPKLIKLNPVVVKEVFNKLLGLQNPNEEVPVSPTELLVALHLIDPAKADLKYIIKATALCFAEKQTFTQDLLAIVLQQLLEEEEIPVLMMRSVLQAHTLYPALGGLILNILQRLIEKEVWCNKVAWEGWVKCAERTLPASCPVLCTLPAGPLTALPAALRLALHRYVQEQSSQKRAALPPHVLNVAQAAYQQTESQFPHAMEPTPPGME